MTQQILLGPQTPTSNLAQVMEAIDVNGPVVVITAGWRDSEGEIEELQRALGRPVEDLLLYHRAEKIFAHEPELQTLKRQRQHKLRELQRLYRLRLDPTSSAARKLMREDADPDLLYPEQRSAISQVRALDRHHLRRIVALHRDHDTRAASIQATTATAQRAEVHERVSNSSLVLIAGGHIAALLNRLRLFSMGEWLVQKPVIAWSAGAMALSDRIVLFHHRAPQGKVDAEVLEAGLGIVQRKVLLPDAKHRLDWSNQTRMALFSRRFAPAVCCTLDNGSSIHLVDGQLVSATGTSVITRTGCEKTLTA